MKVSVVIPTYNRKASLERCLASLAAQNFPQDQYEVLVVADGCTDGTEEFLSSYTPPHAFRWVSQPNQGPGVAQNTGVALASGNIILFLDDDCICEAGVIDAHYAMHTSGERVVAIGTVFIHPDSPAGTLRDLRSALVVREFGRLASQEPRRSDLMLCANTSIARSAALECPLNPAYKRMQDVEAGMRLWAKGYRAKACTGAVAYEYFTKRIAGVLDDARNQGRYEVLLTQVYPDFKPMAGLTRISEGSVVKRWLRKVMGKHAAASEFFLRIAYETAAALGRVPFFASVASRTLRARLGVQHIRGAIEAAGSWEVLEQRFGRRTLVVSYHNVGVPQPREYPGLTTHTSEFEAQLSLMTRMGYQPIVPSEWLGWRDLGGSLPARPVILVFDDGYEEAARNAFPILEQHGFGAACMLVTGCIGSTNRWDEATGWSSMRLMSEDQILDWSRRGIEFGGHTKSHPELPKESLEQLEQEVAGCQQDLTNLLGTRAAGFAYPFGAFDSAAQEAVSRHFRLGFTSWPGSLHLATDPCSVPRVSFLPGESRLAMWCRLRFGKNPFEVLRYRWHRLFHSGSRNLRAS